MSEEKKQEEKKKIKPKKSDNFARNFLLTFLGFFIVVVLISKYAEKKIITLPSQEIQDGKKSEQNTNDYVPSLGEDIMSFAPDEMTAEGAVISSSGNTKISEDTKKTDEHQSPYEQELDKEEKIKQQNLINQQKSNDNFINKINSYRLFLQNANKLVAKFYQGASSANELIIFNSVAHPAKVDAVLVLINEYNDSLGKTDHSNADEIQNNFYQKLLNKFVKIRKISEYEKAKKQLEEKIADILPVFIDYVYSQELLDNFVVNK